MTHATRYRCRYCGLHRWLPERPLSASGTVKAGCNRCENLTLHNPVGTIHA